MTALPLLSPSARRAFDRLATDLRRVLEGRLVSLIASGPRSSVAFVSPILPGDLEALSALVESWHRDGLDTPLFLTPDEFRRSLDAFPLEYQAVIDRHVAILGSPPFEGVEVPASHLRHACEVQAKAHLIHLRQGWLESGGHQDDLGTLIAASAGPLRALLSNVARLERVTPGGDMAAAGAVIANLPEALVRDVLALEAAPEHAEALVPRMPEYLHASEQLWAFIDRWQ